MIFHGNLKRGVQQRKRRLCGNGHTKKRFQKLPCIFNGGQASMMSFPDGVGNLGEGKI